MLQKKCRSVLLFLMLLFSGNSIAQMITAEELGLSTNGLPATNSEKLQEAFDAGTDNLKYKIIWFANKANQGEALYYLEDDLTVPAGVVLKFEAGNKLIGNKTINGGIIESGSRNWIFDPELTIIPQGTSDGTFSVMWFGAGLNGNADDYPGIQKSINISRNHIPRVYLPKAAYVISKPLIVIPAPQTNPFVTLDIFGDGDYWTGMHSSITTNFNHAFAIGVQRGKGVKISKLFFGGQYDSPSSDTTGYYDIDFADYVDTNEPKARDRRRSPYAAIAIDPFTNFNATTPAPGHTDYYDNLDDDNLPDYNQYYNAMAGAPSRFRISGSSGCSVEDVGISGFVVGVVSSPNAITLNEDMLKISRLKIGNCKLAISGGQHQEKMNVVDNLAVWSNIHTIFATGMYGMGVDGRVPAVAGNWIISNVNVAGGVVQFINNQQAGWFPSFISNVYAESLGRFGLLGGEPLSSYTNGSQVSDCNFNFVSPDISGVRVVIGPNISGELDHVTGRGVSFKNCSFRFYDNAKPTMMLINSRANFEDCKFSGVPVQHGQFLNPTLNTAYYTNCTAGLAKFGFDITKHSGKAFTWDEYLRYNKLSLTQNLNYNSGAYKRLLETYKSEGGDVFIPFYPAQPTASSITVNSVDRTLDIPADPRYFYREALVALSVAKPGEIMTGSPVGYGIVDPVSIQLPVTNPLLVSDPMVTHYWFATSTPYVYNGMNFPFMGSLVFAGSNPTSTPVTTTTEFDAGGATATSYGFEVRFKHSAYFSTANTQSVEGSYDGGNTWIHLRTYGETEADPSPTFQNQSIFLPSEFDYASSIKIRFSYTASSTSHWALSDVQLHASDYSQQTIRIRSLTEGMTSGNYYFSCLYPAKNTGTFMGDITGPNTISNVRLDFSAPTGNISGALIKTAYSKATNGWVKVLKYDHASSLMQTLGNHGEPFSIVENGLYFNNGATKIATTASSAGDNLQNATNPNMILYKGMKITELDNSDKQKTTVVCKTGFLPTAVPAGETRIAEFCEPEGTAWKTTGNTIVVNNNVPENIFGTLNNKDVVIKTNNQNVGLIKGNNPGKPGFLGLSLDANFDPRTRLDVDGGATIRAIQTVPVITSILSVNTNNTVTRKGINYDPNSYLSGAGTWETLPTIPTSGVYYADQGLTLDEQSNNSTILLGADCGTGLSPFKTHREINMDQQNLYFNSAEKGKVYIGETKHGSSECMDLQARLTLSTANLPDAKNDDVKDTPGTSGLRFQDLNSTKDPFYIEDPKGVLSLDEDGDVIWIQTPCCEQQRTPQDNEILQRLDRMEGELKAMRIENNKLKSMINSKFNPNIIKQIAGMLFGFFIGTGGQNVFGK